MRYHLLSLLLAVGIILSGCKKDESSTQPSTDNSDIPANPGGNAPATVINNITAIGGTFARTPGNESRIRLSLLGITDPVTNQTVQLVPGTTLWITEDNVLKGVKVTNVGGGNVLNADVVFVVDNSGSMGEEADSIASKIIAFANFLQGSGLSVKVGLVGHGYLSDQKVYGALNLTDAASLAAYLNRATGLQRTVGYKGADSAALATAASRYSFSGGGENSVVGITFADSVFAWRTGANRVYIIFTDEPTQPGGSVPWATEGLLARWTGGKGTIHTVYSADTSRTWTRLQNERPWDLSRGTGGTVKFIPSNAAGLDLTTLPVTGALATSVLLEYLTPNPNGTHNVTVTIRNGSTADGKRDYLNIVY